MVPWTFWTLLSLYVVGRFIRPVCALHMHDWTPMPGRSPNPRIRPVPRHLDGIGCIKKVTTKGVGVLHRSPKIATPSTLWCHRGRGQPNTCTPSSGCLEPPAVPCPSQSFCNSSRRSEVRTGRHGEVRDLRMPDLGSAGRLKQGFGC